MKMNTLGATGDLVSELCLGTMTYGTQTPEADAHRQIDMALEHGINIADSAEVYPVNPISAETLGDSERIIGAWVAKSGRRHQLKIATKVAGEGNKIVRDGAPVSSKTIRLAVEASLRSLQTDYIDLYQLHWANRGSYMFRQHWTFDPTHQDKEETLAHMAEVLGAMQVPCRSWSMPERSGISERFPTRAPGARRSGCGWRRRTITRKSRRSDVELSADCLLSLVSGRAPPIRGCSPS